MFIIRVCMLFGAYVLHTYDVVLANVLCVWLDLPQMYSVYMHPSVL